MSLREKERTFSWFTFLSLPKGFLLERTNMDESSSTVEGLHVYRSSCVCVSFGFLSLMSPFGTLLVAALCIRGGFVLVGSERKNETCHDCTSRTHLTERLECTQSDAKSFARLEKFGDIKILTERLSCPHDRSPFVRLH